MYHAYEKYSFPQMFSPFIVLVKGATVVARTVPPISTAEDCNFFRVVIPVLVASLTSLLLASSLSL